MRDLPRPWLIAGYCFLPFLLSGALAIGWIIRPYLGEAIYQAIDGRETRNPGVVSDEWMASPPGTVPAGYPQPGDDPI